MPCFTTDIRISDSAQLKCDDGRVQSNTPIRNRCFGIFVMRNQAVSQRSLIMVKIPTFGNGDPCWGCKNLEEDQIVENNLVAMWSVYFKLETLNIALNWIEFISESSATKEDCLSLLKGLVGSPIHCGARWELLKVRLTGIQSDCLQYTYAGQTAFTRLIADIWTKIQRNFNLNLFQIYS